ncbi:MAG: hypothetical protein HZB16_13310 [Armatimonadetes bacterium]|nr:hypothetical protein [Armatimonadota bacterium]
MPNPTCLTWLTPEIEDAQAWHRQRVDDLFAGRDTGGPVAIAGRFYGANHGLWGTNAIDMLTEPERWLDDVLADLAAHAREGADRVTFRPLGIEIDPLGTHFVDALFGAEVRFVNNQAWSSELTCELGELCRPDLDASPLLNAALRLAALAVQAGDGRLLISNPVLSCPINVGINLFGERLLWGLLACPDAARHALRVITDVIGECMARFDAVIPPAVHRGSVFCSRYAPAGHGFIDGCATQLVSPRSYAEFIAPLDAELLGQHRHGGMIHLCGAHAQHASVWSSMPALATVQVNDRATDDLAVWTASLRPEQVLYISPTDRYPLGDLLELRDRPWVLQVPLS